MGILGRVLGTLSGGMEERLSEQLLFDKTIGFRGIKDGVGCSTFVFNVACGLIDTTKYSVCVVDTNLLYPYHEYALGLANEEETKDLMDFGGDNLSQIAHKTRYSNIYLVSFSNRYLADMLSSKESQAIVERLFDSLKQFFDIVLVDLSHEPTWATTISALKCNKIYTIVTPDVACLSVLQKSLNSVASTGVPVYKMRKVILNKNIDDVNTGVHKTLENLNLEVVGDIPLSIDIARFGLKGTRIWGAATGKSAISAFNNTIDSILDDICQVNETNIAKVRTEDVDIATLEKESPEENTGIFDDDYVPDKTPEVLPTQQVVQEKKPEKRGLFGKKKVVEEKAPTQKAEGKPLVKKPVEQKPVKKAVKPMQQSMTKPVQQPMAKSTQQPVEKNVNETNTADDDGFDLFAD